MHARCRTIVSALALGIVAVGTLRGQEDAGSTPARAFAETTEVNVVNIEIRVTDKKGRPVTGLVAEDFEIYEDGQPMAIQHFFEVRAASGDRAPTTATTPSDASIPRAALPQLAHPDDAVSWIVYVDNDAVRPAGRGRLLDDLRTHLSKQQAVVARTTIVARTGGAVTTLLPFGSDAAALEAALDTVAETVASGNQVDRLRQTTLRRIQDIFDNPARFADDPCTEGATHLESIVRDYAADMTDHLGRAVSGLRTMTTVLAAVPGRKALLYVGDGLEQLPGLSMFSFLAELCPQSAALFQQNAFVYDESDTLRALADHANANRVTLYTLEARGLRTDSMASVAFGDRRFTPSSQVDRIDVGNLQSSLFLIADETGGRALLGANRFLEPLEDIERDHGTYYSVGYVPPHAGDGRRHVVSIKLVKKRPWQLRHRRGYVDKGPDTRLAERAFGALLFGYEANPLAIEVALLDRATAEPVDDAPGVGSSDRETPDDAATAFLRVAVPRHRLTLLPTPDGGRTGRVRLILAVDDGGDRAAVLKTKRVAVTLGADDSLDRAQIVEVGLVLPPGETMIGIGVHDELGGEQSFLRRTVSVAGDG